MDNKVLISVGYWVNQACHFLLNPFIAYTMFGESAVAAMITVVCMLAVRFIKVDLFYFMADLFPLVFLFSPAAIWHKILMIVPMVINILLALRVGKVVLQEGEGKGEA